MSSCSAVKFWPSGIRTVSFAVSRRAFALPSKHLKMAVAGSASVPLDPGQPATSAAPISRTVVGLGLSSIRSSIGTENPITEEMDHREIAVRVPVMNEVQLLFPSEPCKPLKPRSLHVVFLVEKDVCVERRSTRDRLNHEEFHWQYDVCTRSHKENRDEEERRIIAFVAEVRP